MKLQGYPCLLVVLIAATVVAKKKGKLRKTTEVLAYFHVNSLFAGYCHDMKLSVTVRPRPR